MFLWAPIPESYAHLSSIEFCKLAVNEANVALSPGVGFAPGSPRGWLGASGSPRVRPGGGGRRGCAFCLSGERAAHQTSGQPVALRIAEAG